MDGLSSASAIIAVGSFAIQLAETLQKLHLFWRDIQDAPSDVTALFNELESLLEILHRIRGTNKHQVLDLSSSRVLKECENKVLLLYSRLSLPLSDFKSLSIYRRKWSALKITLEKPLIESARTSIREAKSTLTLAQLNTLQERLEDQHQLLLGISQTISLQKNFSSIQSSQTEVIMQIEKFPNYVPEDSRKQAACASPSMSLPPVSRLLVVEKHQIVRSSKLEISTPLWSVRSRSSIRNVVKKHAARGVPMVEKDSELIFYPSNYLKMLGISSGISLQMRSVSGWQFTLRPFNAVPYDAPIFQFCRDGNIGGIRTLISSGHASLRDLDPDGRTPLWFAVKSLQHEAATFLLEQGADTQVCDWDSGRPPIVAVCKTSEVEVHKKVSMIDLIQRYSPDSYDEVNIAFLTGILLLFYRPGKLLDGFTTRDKTIAAMEIIKQLLPYFPQEGSIRTWILRDSMLMGLDPEVLRLIARNIQGRLYDAPHMSILHEVISGGYLHRDLLLVRMVTEKTRNIHRRIGFPDGPDRPVVIPNSTPTTLAMYQRGTFLLWLSLLRDTGHKIESFVAEELEQSLLAEQGWAQHTLEALFGLRLRLEAKEQHDVSPDCERCGKSGWRKFRPMIDLDWRRQLRDIRLCVPSSSSAQQVSRDSKVMNITLPFAENHLSKEERTATAKYTGGHPESPIPSKPKLDSRPYNIVCSDECEDGVCVAWIYENDFLEEPECRPYVEKEMVVDVVEVHDVQLVDEKYEEEEMDERQRAGRRMPGSFED